MPPRPAITVRGARCHNLKNIDLDIPLGSFSVITGVSGSGKSSLAFDTLYAEGQRRYVETFSPYTRQFLERMDKPPVDRIDGIPPAVALSQANAIRSSRSTVGTLTEISDYLKLLFARKARLFSPATGREIRPWKPEELADHLIATFPDTPLLIGVDIPFAAKTRWKSIVSTLSQQGIIRHWTGSGAERLIEMPARKERTIRALLTRLEMKKAQHARIAETLENAFRLSGASQTLWVIPDSTRHPSSVTGNDGRLQFASSWTCPDSGQSFTPPSPALFSFNNPVGACPQCRGFGRTVEIDYDQALPDRNLSIGEGVVKPFQTEANHECQEDLERACKRKKIPLDQPFRKLTAAQQKFVIEGEPGTGYKNRWYGVKGFFTWLETRTYKVHVRVLLSRYRAYRTCPACQGHRFQPEVVCWSIGGKTLSDLNEMPLADFSVFSQALEPADKSEEILIEQVRSRAGYLNQVGLGYLNLNRSARTLSGGEIQRVNLTTCLGSSLVGTLFVLDEPSIGLHPRDTTRLIHTLQDLTRRGNTTLVVEHDDQFMRAADELIELGPSAGARGGQLIAQGHWLDLVHTNASQGKKSKVKGERPPHPSLSAAFLSGARRIPIPEKRRPIPPSHPALKIEGASMNNIRDLDVTLPLRRFVAITGVSGSGKSTLLHHLIFPQIKKQLGQATGESGSLRKLSGTGTIKDIHIVDQSPLTKTPRSTPLLYLGCYDQVRDLFAQTDQALRSGLRASSFSFNSGDGRCTRCQGTGFEKITMQFLSDLYVTCPICEGRRFQKHVLDIHWRDRSIHDVLEMTVDEAIPFFEGGISRNPPAHWDKTEKLQSRACENILRQISLLRDVGLGYLRLGQPLNHLSGGEAQRLKLVSHLQSATTSQKSESDTILILDEPTTGLHFADIEILLKVLQRMVDQGLSLFVIEHNLDLIKGADFVLDLGPEAGDGGGQVVATGTPETIAKCKDSHTGRYLKLALNGSQKSELEGRSPQPPKQTKNKERKTTNLSSSRNTIEVRGARHHNLKNINVDIPRDSMVVLTGLSGSGKSTLAFDLLFSEGQRRYLDCLNTYARQFIEQLEKPDVDAILGLPPTVAIEQRTTRGGAKSTVATVTELYHFLRLLYAKIGVQHDPGTGEPAIQQSAQEIITRIRQSLKNAKQEVAILTPLVKNRKGIYNEIGRWAVRQQLPFLRVDGKWITPDQFTALDRYREHAIDAVLGNTSTRDPQFEVLINRALALGHGTLYTIDDQSRETIYSTELYCPGSGRSFEPLDPRLFSYNSPYGWCPACQGYGTRHLDVRVDPRLEGAEREAAIEAALENRHAAEEDTEDTAPLPDGGGDLCPECHGSRLNEVARAVHFLGQPVTEWNHLNVDAFARAFAKIKLTGRQADIARDILPEIRQRLKFLQHVGLGYLQLDRSATTLSGGEGQRIRLAAQLGSNLQGVLYILDEPTIGLHPRDNRQLLEILQALKDRGNSLIVVEHDEDTMKQADAIIDLGPGAGIHGGEIVAQGHWRELVHQHTQVKNSSGLALAQTDQKNSRTADLLGDPIPHPLRGAWRAIPARHPHIAITGARAHNLKNFDLRIPRQRLIALSGVSGSGKSTLLHEVIRPAVDSVIKRNEKRPSKAVAKGESKIRTTPFETVSGADGFDRVLEITQAPIGKTSRSTVATYIGLMDHLRDLYAALPLAKARGFKKGHFSYNAGQGRCPACQGQGTIKVEMNFLPPTYIPCEQCQGRRWTNAVLEAEFQGRSIHDTLNLSVDEAADLFTNQPKVSVPLQLLRETGLGYLKIGQTSPTLSGGEAQRLKLVAELTKAELTRQRHILKSSNPQLPENLYLLEEPTVGLHLADVRKLIDLLHRLVEAGHTVIVIEHHLDVIAEADYIFDIGPESGDAGGRIVAQGPPEKIAAARGSHTAPFLKEVLQR